VQAKLELENLIVNVLIMLFNSGNTDPRTAEGSDIKSWLRGFSIGGITNRWWWCHQRAFKLTLKRWFLLDGRLHLSFSYKNIIRRGQLLSDLDFLMAIGDPLCVEIVNRSESKHITMALLW